MHLKIGDSTRGGGDSFIGLGTFIQIKVHKKYNLNCTNEAPD